MECSSLPKPVKLSGRTCTGAENSKRLIFFQKIRRRRKNMASKPKISLAWQMMIGLALGVVFGAFVDSAFAQTSSPSGSFSFA